MQDLLNSFTQRTVKLYDADMNLVATIRCSCPDGGLDPKCPTHGTRNNPGSCRFF